MSNGEISPQFGEFAIYVVAIMVLKVEKLGTTGRLCPLMGLETVRGPDGLANSQRQQQRHGSTAQAPGHSNSNSHGTATARMAIGVRTATADRIYDVS